MKQFDLWLKRTLGMASGAVLMTLMLLTTVDVIGRKLDVPIRGGVEMSEILLAMLIFAGLPLVSEARQHIVIDTLEGFMRCPYWFVPGICAPPCGSMPRKSDS